MAREIIELANKPGRIFIETPELQFDWEELSPYAPYKIDFAELSAYVTENNISGWHDIEEFCHLESVPEFPGAFRWVMGAEATTETEDEEAPVDETENSTALYYERMEMELSGIRCR